MLTINIHGEAKLKCQKPILTPEWGYIRSTQKPLSTACWSIAAQRKPVAAKEVHLQHRKCQKKWLISNIGLFE